MAANPNVGSDPESGPAGTPNQAASPEASQSIGGDVTKLLADLESKFSARVSQIESRMGGMREIQSRIDTAQNDFQQQLARLEQYKAQGLSQEEALAEMQSDDAAEKRWSNLEKKLDTLAERFANGGTQASGQQAVTKVFEAIGLDVKDPRVASALLTQYKSAEEVELAAYRLQRQIQQSPNPNPAQNASLTGNASQGAADLDAIYAQYAEAFKNPTQNAELMKSLEAQMKQLGG